MTDNRKEYIKTFVIRVIKGKVDKDEFQQVKQNLMNYSREDWKDLKIIGKELVKEAIDEQINKEELNQIPEDWKSLARDHFQAWVNLLFAIFNEEVFYQSVLLEKQGAGLDEKTKIIKILPVISSSIDRVVARAPSNRPVNNWKADKSLVARIKKIVREVKGVYFQSLRKKEWQDNEIKAKLSKFAGILESLSVEEIAVFKSKLKIFANNLVDKYAPPQIKNSPEIRQLINSAIDLMNALNDEKLWKDSIRVLVKVVKLGTSNQQIWESKDVLTALQKTGMEGEVKNLLRSYTQHINKLAGEGEQNNNLSTEREEDIIKRFNENNSNPNQGDANLEDIWKDNLLTNSSFAGGGNLAKTPTQESLLRDFENVFLDTQIKPKWYQNPWFIGLSIAGGVVIGGLIVWWLMRRKKERRVEEESNF